MLWKPWPALPGDRDTEDFRAAHAAVGGKTVAPQPEQIDFCLVVKVLKPPTHKTLAKVSRSDDEVEMYFMMVQNWL